MFLHWKILFEVSLHSAQSKHMKINLMPQASASKKVVYFIYEIF